MKRTIISFLQSCGLEIRTRQSRNDWSLFHDVWGQQLRLKSSGGICAHISFHSHVWWLVLAIGRNLSLAVDQYTCMWPLHVACLCGPVWASSQNAKEQESKRRDNVRYLYDLASKSVSIISPVCH